MLQCNLCHSLYPKLANAHIIPKSFFNLSSKSPWGICEENGYYQVITVDKGVWNSKRSPTGIYDPKIVCSECEKRFDQADDHGYKILSEAFKKKKLVYSLYNKQPLYLIENVNYHKLKLFFLSMLWRAHASSYSFFLSVDLGIHETILRSYILQDKVPSQDEYEVILFCQTDFPYSPMGFQPSKINDEGVDFYLFHLPPSFTVLIKIDKQPLPKKYKQFVLKENKLKQFFFVIYSHSDCAEEQIAVKNLFNSVERKFK